MSRAAPTLRVKRAGGAVRDPLEPSDQEEVFLSRRLLTALAALAVVVAFSACTSDNDTPLGSEFIGDILGSRPGVVFRDTIPVLSGDTVVTFYSLISNSTALQLGRADGYDRWMVLRADFSKAGADTAGIVDEAKLKIIFSSSDETRDIRAVFYRLGSQWSEGDTITTLDTLTAIVDPETGSRQRTMKLAERTYPLPVDLVQGWIKGDSTHNGIAVVFTDLIDGKVISFKSSEVSSSDDRPKIQVVFRGTGTLKNYNVRHDGTFVRPVETTSNLVVSDGFVRRVYFPVDLSQVNDSAAVHSAVVRLNFVPETVVGGDQTVLLYVPNSTDPTSAKFRSGQPVSQVTMNSLSGVLEFPVTNVLLLILSGDVPDNGFVFRFNTENASVRQAEFFTSSSDSLRPRVLMTYSTPADFDK